MFFADPVAALANVHKAMKKGGGSFSSAGAHPPRTVVGRARKRRQTSASSDGAAAARRAGALCPRQSDRVKSILLRSGFHAPELKKFDATIHLGGHAGGCGVLQHRWGTLARTLADADAETRKKVRSAVIERFAREWCPAAYICSRLLAGVRAHLSLLGYAPRCTEHVMTLTGKMSFLALAVLLASTSAALSTGPMTPTKPSWRRAMVSMTRPSGSSPAPSTATN